MNKDLLDRIVETLAPLHGSELRKIAAASGVSYDTVARIAGLSPDRYDPGYSKVKLLSEFLFKKCQA